MSQFLEIRNQERINDFYEISILFNVCDNYFSFDVIYIAVNIVWEDCKYYGAFIFGSCFRDFDSEGYLQKIDKNWKNKHSIFHLSS